MRLQVILKFAHELGPIYRIRILWNQVVMLSDPADAAQVRWACCALTETSPALAWQCC
jgi:hypothetical protein